MENLDIKEKEFMDEWDKVLFTMPTFFRSVEGYGLIENVRALAYGFYMKGKTVAMEDFIARFNKKV